MKNKKLIIKNFGEIKAFGDNIIVIPLLTRERQKLFREESDMVSVLPEDSSVDKETLKVLDNGTVDVEYSVPMTKSHVVIHTLAYKFGNNDCYEGIVYSCGNKRLKPGMIIGFGSFSVVLNRLKYNLDRDWLVTSWSSIYYWMEKDNYYAS